MSLPFTSFEAAACQSARVGLLSVISSLPGEGRGPVSLLVWTPAFAGEQKKSMLALRSLHQLDQHAAHVLRMDEDHRRAVRADAGLAQHLRALRLHLGPGFMDVRHL